MIIWNKAPVCRILFPYLIGIPFGYFVELHLFIPYLIAACVSCWLVLALFPFQFWQRNKRAYLFSVLVFCVSVLLTTYQKSFWQKPYFKSYLTNQANLRLQLLEPFSEKSNSMKTVAEVVSVNDSTKEQSSFGKIIVYCQKNPALLKLGYGDELIAKNRISPIRSASNPFEFDAKKHLSHQAVYYSCYLKNTDYRTVLSSGSVSIRRLGYQVRDYCIEVFRKHGLQGEEFAVASAMILGFEDELNPQIISYFSASGAMHLLSVSGLHIAFVYIILTFLLKPLRRFKWGSKAEFVITVFVLWFYAIVTGFSPPVLRSAMMFSFAVYAKTFNKKLNMFNVCATAALFILVVQPLALFDVGFQLSFMALVSILLVQPFLSEFYHSKHVLIQKTWELIAVSIAATVLTLPFTFYYFHQFPNYFLLVNLLVIPLSTVLLYLGFAALIFSFIPPLSQLLVWVLMYVTRLLNAVLRFDEQLPFSVTKNIYFSDLSLMLLAVALGCFIYYLHFSQQRFKRISLALLLMFLFDSSFDYASKINRQQITFYSIRKHVAIDFISSYSGVLLADTSMLRQAQSVMHHIQPNRIANYATSFTECSLQSDMQQESFMKVKSIVRFHGKTILIPQKEDLSWLLSRKIKFDYVVLSSPSVYAMQQLISHVDAKQYIIEPVYSLQSKRKIIHLLHQSQKNFWDIQERGAYIVEL